MRHSTKSAARGFSLIELMIGMTIGLIATMVIIQVMSFFEAQRRATTGSADAQTNGGIALFSIAREMQMAGYPLLPVTDSPLECTTVNVVAGATGITGISPVSITDGTASAGVSASDSITIRYGTSLTGGATTQIASVGTLGVNVVGVASSLSCQATDVTLVSSGATCTLSNATATSSTAGANSVTLTNITNAAIGANLACLGTWNEVTYQVDQTTGTLNRIARVTSNATSTVTTTPSVTGVVNLQAQYGISATANSNQITAWVEPSGATWAAPTVANRNRIKAVRISVIARNAKSETSNVSSACSSTTAASPTGLCAWEGTAASPAPAVDLSQMDANWARYRYRVFSTIIPLRNVIWSKDTL